MLYYYVEFIVAVESCELFVEGLFEDGDHLREVLVGDETHRDYAAGFVWDDTALT
jgi:hypothetical protein